MVEVEKLCKKILFMINLGRIKQITSDKCSSKGGGGFTTPSTPPLDPPLRLSVQFRFFSLDKEHFVE